MLDKAEETAVEELAALDAATETPDDKAALDEFTDDGVTEDAADASDPVTDEAAALGLTAVDETAELVLAPADEPASTTEQPAISRTAAKVTAKNHFPIPSACRMKTSSYSSTRRRPVGRSAAAAFPEN